MRSILLLILSANVVFYFTASLSDTGDRKRLPMTETNISLLCFVGDKPSKECNTGDNMPTTSLNKTQKKISADLGTIASRPAKRIRTRSDGNTGQTLISSKPQQVASLGNPSINTKITTPINPQPRRKPRPIIKKVKMRCRALGPFIDRADALSLNSQLKSLKVRSVVRTVKERERFWVYLQDDRSPSKTVSALRRKGVRTYKIVARKGHRNVVSIGWFNNHSSATNRYKKLASLGFMPKLVVKGSPGKQVWVNYSLPVGKRLSSAARKVVKQAKEESYFQTQRCK
ncbi:hypothetical protein MNBD_GAMMA12-597 [hydrothermal vent metagenome]|uniref:SPOR domain-containing protein n=1 Tax=hydrothermal vent metagenome TaxID=652676 RepID=A0A3B0YM86_9ZZZZ